MPNSAGNISTKPEPKVWNAKNPDIPFDARYINRHTRFGNPFLIGQIWNGKAMTRDDVCDRFEAEVLPNLDVSELRGCHLVCHCKPYRCHGDSILRKANA